MPTTSRFPFAVAQNGNQGEADQIISIFPATATIPRGGGDGWYSVEAWKQAGIQDECPYSDIVIEIVSNTAPFTLGNGTTDRIGLYGMVDRGDGTSPVGRRRYLLGVLGINLGNTAPQVPFVQGGLAAEIINFAQVVCNVGAYNLLAIGGVTADIVTGGPLITVTARPIRKRDYAG